MDESEIVRKCIDAQLIVHTTWSLQCTLITVLRELIMMRNKIRHLVIDERRITECCHEELFHHDAQHTLLGQHGI